MKKILFKFESLKGQWLICPKGKHSPSEFNIIDPEDNDLVGKIFKIHGYVDFGGRALSFDIPTKENFNGCAIHFTGIEIGPELKALIISAAVMLVSVHILNLICTLLLNILNTQ